MPHCKPTEQHHLPDAESAGANLNLRILSPPKSVAVKWFGEMFPVLKDDKGNAVVRRIVQTQYG
jgi:hypothetical protein